MTFASSETQGQSVGSGKTAAKLFKAWRESPTSPWDVGCDLPRVHSGDWRLAIGRKNCVRFVAPIRCDCAQSGASICRTAFVILLYEVAANSTVHRVRFATSSFECSSRLVSSDWAQIVATATVPNRGPASVARLYEVGANSTVHRVHEFTVDQFTVRILRLVHFLFSFIFANLLNYGISSGFV